MKSCYYFDNLEFKIYIIQILLDIKNMIGHKEIKLKTLI
jgi:hypothetical protein